MNDFFYKNLETYKVAKEFVIYTYSLLQKSPYFVTWQKKCLKNLVIVFPFLYFCSVNPW